MNVVIFGLGPQSILARNMLNHDSRHQLVGFTVDAAYRTIDHFDGLPVVSFDCVEERFPPDRCSMFVPLGWKGMNTLRAERFAQSILKGYSFFSYISSRALVWKDLLIGRNCTILEGAIVEPFTMIGDNCNLRSNCIISHYTVIADHCFIGAHAVVGSGTTIGERCALGLNCIICDGIKVAAGCFIGAGAVVTADTSENGIYLGVPAIRCGQPANQLRNIGP